jgi:tetratricopeptide (TPR) repeat protein
MSPEQAQMGEMDIDTRTDIYSLGVLLYELLTGTTPFNGERLRNSAYDEMLKTIRETEPPKPSTKLSTLGEALTDVAKHRKSEPKQLCKMIRGELDWIVLKTLEKDRRRRYETANELAADIKRHLGDEPVAAGPPSAGYRLRKFVRRHRTGVMFGLLVAAALAIGFSLALVGFVQARRERNRAETNFQKARDAVEEMKLVAEGLLVNRPRLEKLQPQLLQTVQAYYRGFLEENRNNPEVRHEIGVAYKDLGFTHWTLGKPEQALAAYGKSIKVFEELAADSADQAEYKKQIAITSNWIGVALSTLRRYDEALEVYHRAAVLLEGLVAEFGDEPEYMLPLSWVYRHRGFVFLWTGKLEEAEKAFRETLEIREKLAADYPDEQGYQHELALILGPLGNVLTRTGRYDEAEQALRRAVEISEKAAELSEVPEHRRELATNYSWLGDALLRMGRNSQAEDAFREAIKLSKQLTDEFGLDPIYSRTQAWGCFSLTQVLRRSGQLAEAEKACGEAIQLFARLAADYPEVPEHEEGLANSYGSLGDVLKDIGKLEEAEKAYQKAQVIRKNMEAEKTKDQEKNTEGSKE